MPKTTILVYRDEDGEVPICDWLADLKQREPNVYPKCLERILRLSDFGFELRRPLADFLRDGIYELRIRREHINYRMLYGYCGQNVAVLTHGFTKEGDVPDKQIDAAIAMLNNVKRDVDKHTAVFDPSSL